MIADWLNTAFASFDYAILEFCHKLAEAAGGFLGPVMEFFALIGDNGYFSFALALVLLLFKKTRKCGVCIILAVGFGALFTNVAIKNVVARPRPYASDVQAFKDWWIYAGAHSESEFSFPSGHATAAVASMLALCLCFFKKHKWVIAPASLYAVIMGFSRNYLLVHYPTDVAAGFIVGSAAAVLAFFVTKLLWNWAIKNEDKKIIGFALNFDVISLFGKKERQSSDENK